MRIFAPENWTYLLLCLVPLVFQYFTTKGSQELIKKWTLRAPEESIHNWRHGKLELARYLFIGLALVLVAMSLLRPQWGEGVERIVQGGRDIVILVDTSKSMDARDAYPSRLELAKLAIGKLMDGLAGSRFGLVAFSGQAAAISPLTPDRSAFKTLLSSLDSSTFSQQGTAIAEGLTIASEMFQRSQTNPDSPKIIVIVSDGEDFEGGYEEVIKQEPNTKIFTLGVGSVQGTRIPLRDRFGRDVDFIRDSTNQEVITRLDGERLAKIAQMGLGKYVELGSSLGEVNQIIESIDKPGEGSGASVDETIDWQERFYVLLIPAVLIFSVVIVVNGRMKSAGIFWILLLVTNAVTPSAFASVAESFVNRGVKAGEDKAKADWWFRMARSLNPQLSLAYYNEGVAAQRANNLALAHQKYLTAKLHLGNREPSNRELYDAIRFNLAKIAEASNAKDEAINHYLDVIFDNQADTTIPIVIDSKLALQKLLDESSKSSSQSDEDQQGSSQNKQDQQKPKDQRDNDGQQDQQPQESGESKPTPKPSDQTESEPKAQTSQEKQRILESLKGEEKDLIKKVRNRQTNQINRNNVKEKKNEKYW